MSTPGHFPIRPRWVFAALGFCALAPGMSFAQPELRCEAKYHLVGHLRDSHERGGCEAVATVDGPEIGSIVVDPKIGGKSLKDDKIAVVEVLASRDEKAEAMLTRIKQRPSERATATASTEGYLRKEGGDLVSVAYIGEVDPDPKSQCVNSRFLKVTCRLSPKQ